MNSKSKRYKKGEDSLGEKLSKKEVQDLLLEMMKALHDFCIEHNIRYCLCDGSLLGAVRHKGFIPWDDDMDVYMPRPDYEKFIKFSQISDKYEIVTYFNDHGYYHPYAYCSLTDRSTVMVEKNMRCPTGKGQFIDIFPVDGVSDDIKLRKRQFRKLNFYAYLKGLQSIDYRNNKAKGIKNFIKRLCAILLTPMDEMKIVEKQDKLAKLFSFEECSHFSQLISGKDRNMHFPKTYFDHLILVPFEKYEFYITSYYDEALRLEYGDYLKLPPVEQRVGKHGVDIYKRKSWYDKQNANVKN